MTLDSKYLRLRDAIRECPNYESVQGGPTDPIRMFLKCVSEGEAGREVNAGSLETLYGLALSAAKLAANEGKLREFVLPEPPPPAAPLPAPSQAVSDGRAEFPRPRRLQGKPQPSCPSAHAAQGASAAAQPEGASFSVAPAPPMALAQANGSDLEIEGANSNGSEIKIVVRADFACLLPQLTPQEVAALEQSIIDEGCRDALVVWRCGGDHVLVDGHNRHRICSKHGMQFSVIEKSFSDEADARAWILRNAQSRRNATPASASYVRGIHCLTVRDLQGDARKFSARPSWQRLAKEWRVDEKTLRNDAHFARKLDELCRRLGDHVKAAVFAGEVKLGRKVLDALVPDGDDDDED